MESSDLRTVFFWTRCSSFGAIETNKNVCVRRRYVYYFIYTKSHLWFGAKMSLFFNLDASVQSTVGLQLISTQRFHWSESTEESKVKETIEEIIPQKNEQFIFLRIRAKTKNNSLGVRTRCQIKCNQNFNQETPIQHVMIGCERNGFRWNRIKATLKWDAVSIRMRQINEGETRRLSFAVLFLKTHLSTLKPIYQWKWMNIPSQSNG